MNDFGPSAIIHSQIQLDGRTLCGLLFGDFNPALQFIAQTLPVTDKAESDLFFDQPVHFIIKVSGKQLHQEADFFARPAPVFGRKGISRQDLHSDFSCIGQNIAQNLGAGFVAEGSRQAAFLGPTPVTVHDDGDVLGDSCRIQRFHCSTFHSFVATPKFCDQAGSLLFLLPVRGNPLVGGGFNQGASIADTGQTAAHAPHSTQTSSSITYGVPSLIAPTGQVDAQVPHATQVSLIL